MSFEGHPTHEIKGAKTDSLKDKKIVLGVTGSIAAIMSVKLSRELIRHGAEVKAVMTDYAEEIITENSLEYATGCSVVTSITGKVEHVRDIVGEADLFLIAPSTANTIGKIANGIDDTTVTTYATTALSRNIPIIIVPAMDLSMYRHPFVKQNIDKLRENDIEFVGPEIKEGKAKMAGINQIVRYTKRKLSKKDLNDKKILITGGATAEPIDDVRILTNRSSGRMGIELAKAAYERGAEPHLIHGRTTIQPPKEIKTTKVETAKEMEQKVLETLKNNIDIFISAAAISDFIPEKKEGKIKSRKPQNLSLKPSEKIIKKVSKKHPETKIIGFKLEPTLQKSLKSAKNKLKQMNIDIIIGNPVSTMGSEQTKAYLVTEKNIEQLEGDKNKVANQILNNLT